MTYVKHNTWHTVVILEEKKKSFSIPVVLKKEKFDWGEKPQYKGTPVKQKIYPV